MSNAPLPAPPADIRGSVTARLYTPPLVTGPPGPCGCGCALTPDTSDGFDLTDFAAEIGLPLDPWQRWAAIHGLELLPDGRPRFRKLLIIVARQNGKTLLVRVLILFWLFIDKWPLTVGTSADRRKAWEEWKTIITMATGAADLARELPATYRRDTTGQEDFWTVWDSHYVFAAPNRRAGRGGTLNRAVLDELREHLTYAAHDAIKLAMNAVRTAQLVAISNQGDITAVVLRSLRAEALDFITTGDGDPRVGLLEWSAPEDADPTDLYALAMANPDLGGRIDPEVLLADARAAIKAGGEQLSGFKTEVMCLAVDVLTPAIAATAWSGLRDEAPPNLADHRDRLALCLEVSKDGDHATLAGAAVLPDGRVHLEMLAAWSSTKALRDELPALVARIKPRVLGWFPAGPTAAVLATLRNPGTGKRWPPTGVKLDEITRETAAVCMGFDEQIKSRDVRHPDDPLLNAHIANATTVRHGSGWIYSRRGNAPVDALYASAGAVHLARVLPPPPPPLSVVSTEPGGSAFSSGNVYERTDLPPALRPPPRSS